jgi:hypothetical protein
VTLVTILSGAVVTTLSGVTSPLVAFGDRLVTAHAGDSEPWKSEADALADRVG